MIFDPVGVLSGCCRTVLTVLLEWLLLLLLFASAPLLSDYLDALLVLHCLLNLSPHHLHCYRETDELQRRLERMQHLEERALGCRAEEMPSPITSTHLKGRGGEGRAGAGRAGEGGGGTQLAVGSEPRVNVSRQQQQPWVSARKDNVQGTTGAGVSTVQDDFVSFTQLCEMKPARRALYWETLRTRLKRQLAEREEMARVATWQSSVVAEARGGEHRAG